MIGEALDHPPQETPPPVYDGPVPDVDFTEGRGQAYSDVADVDGAPEIVAHEDVGGDGYDTHKGDETLPPSEPPHEADAVEPAPASGDGGGPIDPPEGWFPTPAGEPKGPDDGSGDATPGEPKTSRLTPLRSAGVRLVLPDGDRVAAAAAGGPVRLTVEASTESGKASYRATPSLIPPGADANTPETGVAAGAVEPVATASGRLAMTMAETLTFIAGGSPEEGARLGEVLNTPERVQRYIDDLQTRSTETGSDLMAFTALALRDVEVVDNGDRPAPSMTIPHGPW